MREQAYAADIMKTSTHDEDDMFRRLLPLLDHAIDQLRAPDREVIIRRYLEGQDFRTICKALGITEDARAFMTLNYGQMLIDVDSSNIRGLANMVSAGLRSEMPEVDIDSRQYQQWTQDNKTRRIENELSSLRNILDERQLTRYREHLEAEPAW